MGGGKGKNLCKINVNCNLTSQKYTINDLCNLIKYLIFKPTCLNVYQTRNLRQTYINSYMLITFYVR